MITKKPLLISVLIAPEASLDLNLQQWDLLIRQARRSGVLARFGYMLERKSLLTEVPSVALKHIQSAQTYAYQMGISLNWEIHCIQKVFDSLGLPLVFLKGTAYSVANNIAAAGRFFSDVDVLVPEDRLVEVERALIHEGWKSAHVDAYDQRFYREWMHEIPPMEHTQRHTSIDVHHNILPKTSRFCPNPELLLANIINVSDKNAWVLAPEDRVIHSATHLFHEGEFDHGFRDLSDLDLLLKEFDSLDGFWDKLLKHAEELKQQLPLYYALRYSSIILQTPVPEEVLESSKQWFPNKVHELSMDWLFCRALMPNHPSCETFGTGFARWILYIRSHWIKMPFYLLIPHLCRKGWLRLFEQKED